MTWIGTAFVGALLGWWLVTLLFFFCFQPKKPIRLANFVWQGLVPRWLNRNLIPTLASWVHALKPSQEIQKRLLAPETRMAVDHWITQQADLYLTHTLPAKWPMISMLIGDKTQEKVRQALSEFLAENWEKNIDSLTQKHLTEAALCARLESLLQTEDVAGWTVRIEQAATRLKRGLLLISIPTGALLAIAGRFLHQLLLSI